MGTGFITSIFHTFAVKAKAEAAMAKRQDKQAVTKPVDDPAEAQRKEEKMARRELIFRWSITSTIYSCLF